MKRSMLVAMLVMAVLVSAGCHRRADYLQPKTGSNLVNNTLRAATVLFPLSMAGNILVSEIMRDTERCDRNGCQAYTCDKCAEEKKSDCGCDK